MLGYLKTGGKVALAVLSSMGTVLYFVSTKVMNLVNNQAAKLLIQVTIVKDYLIPIIEWLYEFTSRTVGSILKSFGDGLIKHGKQICSWGFDTA